MSARRARAEVDEEAMAEPRTMEEVMEARREARRVAAGIRRVPPPAASKEPEGDCVITGSRSAKARDAELMRDAITVADSDAEPLDPKWRRPNGVCIFIVQVARSRLESVVPLFI